MPYEILLCSKEGIEKCVSIIRRGGVIVFPTDTIYGIGCDPYNDNAVDQIFLIKGRDEKKPLPVLAASLEDARRLVKFNAAGEALARQFWPGALTLVAPLADKKISTKVTAGKNSLGIRVPSDDCALAFLSKCRYIVGTSANPSGKRSPASAQDVIDSMLSGFDAILVNKRSAIGMESTIVDLTGPKPRIVREGGIRADEIYRVIGQQ